MCKKLNIYEEIAKESTDILKNEIRNYYKTKSRRNELKLSELETSINNTPGKPLRSVTTLIRDGVVTTKQLIPDRGQDQRTRALIEVLCSIPYRDYENLKQTFENDRVLIQVPRKGLAGCVSRIERNIDCTLYLSPQLESCQYSYILNTVAHELSHVLLHSDYSSTNKNLIEKQADLQVLSWGF